VCAEDQPFYILVGLEFDELIRMYLGLKDYLTATWRLLNGTRVAQERGALEQRERDISAYINIAKRLRVLDLANGNLWPQYILLKAEGHEVTGIDIVNGSNSGWPVRGYKIARWLYSWHVDNLDWKSLRIADKRLVCGDVSTLPFSNDYFDLVTSIAAFEHFLNVPAVIGEVRRVLRPGGLVWIGIHPFACPSGGHNITATEIPLHSLPTGVEPWDHLRRRRLPITVPLNEWRIGQYLDAFGSKFEILKHYCVIREGEHFLTPEIEAELSDYDRDELTCMAYIIVARKDS
jgi:SAM-dependent methyltransferase